MSFERCFPSEVSGCTSWESRKDKQGNDLLFIISLIMIPVVLMFLFLMI